MSQVGPGVTGLGLFDSAAEARDKAIASVAANHDEWIEKHALPAITKVSAMYVDFTCEDLRSYIKVDPLEPRAMGAAMMEAKKRGIIEPTDQFRNSTGAINHKRPMRVWRACRQARAV